ncbi:MAG: hypothetical protein IPJ00_05120 [Saprospirales bacterium]|nr:hypothetical protein [Saprospirales bacterium]
MRFFIALLLILGLNNFIYSQNCYAILADLTGVDMPSHESSLEAAALDLKKCIPPENQLQFKVFDYGFYSMNEYTQGGFQGVWDKVITDVTSCLHIF